MGDTMNDDSIPLRTWSRSGLARRFGDMPNRNFDRYVATGLIGPPGHDGRWDDAAILRMEAAQRLAKEAPNLERRVLLMSMEGFPVGSPQLREAVAAVLERIRPAARKMREVRRELFELARRTAWTVDQAPRRPRSFGFPRPPAGWPGLIRATDDETFELHYPTASTYAQFLLGRLPGFNAGVEVPREERLALVLVNLLAADTIFGGRPGNVSVS